MWSDGDDGRQYFAMCVNFENQRDAQQIAVVVDGRLLHGMVFQHAELPSKALGL